IAPVNGRRTSSFGLRNTGIPGASTNHQGVDIGGNPRGSKPDVLAPQSGRVIDVQRKVVNARGLYVMIRGADADFLVQHLDSIPKNIKVGKKVRLGQKLGVMGNTSTVKIALHLHFEVHVNGRAVDPEDFYPRHGQPTPWERPGEGVRMKVKFKSRHLLLRSYFEDRKTVAALRPGGFRINTALSTWKGWTITRANRYYPTSRLTKA